MKLYADQKLFSETLAKLSYSKYHDQVGFKGGTSLAKAHKLQLRG